MALFNIEKQNLDEGVLRLILLKQVEFKVEKKRCVSLTYTINRLLKEGYKSDIDEMKKKKKS